MLRQNWFMNENFIMFKECYDIQVFFDTKSRCIYVVDEDEENNVRITQYDDENDELYYPLYQEYINYIERFYLYKNKKGEHYDY